MFSFAAVLIALLLIPTFLCTIILQLFFRRNTLKVSEAHLFPFGLGLTLLFNLPRMFKFLELLNPPCCFPKEEAEHMFVLNMTHVRTELLREYVYFLTLPVATFAILTAALYFIWRYKIINPEKKLNFLLEYLARITDDLLVNYMGKMTAYSPPKHMVLVDVLDSKDSLYSGIFYNYFIEDKKLVGVQLTNVIRYSFKSESERKAAAEKGDYDKFTPYLLPNNGRMFFPVENIENLHFWYLKKDQTERLHIKTPEKQVRFAWLLGIKYSLPHLNLNIKGILYRKHDSLADLKPLRKAYNTLGLDKDNLIKNIEVIGDQKEPAQKPSVPKK